MTLRTLASTRSPRKRKRAATDFAEASSDGSQKQAKVRTTSALTSAQKEDHTDSRLEVATSKDCLRGMSVLTEGIESSALRPCNLLIRNLYLLQEVLAQRDSDPKELATALCDISSSICNLILAMHSSKDLQHARPSLVGKPEVRNHNGSAAPSRPCEDVKTTLLAIRQAFPSLLEGMHRLNNLPGGSQARGQAIWSLIKIFDGLLDQIYSLSTAQASQPPDNAPRASKSRTKTQLLVTATPEETQSRSKTRTPCQACRKRHRKCDSRIPTCRNCECWKMQCKRDIHPCSGNAPSSKSRPTFTTPPEDALILCELTIAMMRCLDVTIPSDMEILEGFLFLLLKRVGQALKVFVFEDGILQDPEVDSIGSTAPNGIATNHQATEAQAPCLIYLLEQAQSFTTTLSIQPQANPKSTELPQNPTLRSSSTTLSTLACSRLQHTLLTAVFGDQTRNDFQAALSPPKPTISDEVSAKFSEGIRAEGVKDWFKHEVWRIVGWDALREVLRMGEDGV